MKITLEIIRFNIDGVETHYSDKVWVKDGSHPEGGYYAQEFIEYELPKAKIDFLAKVNVDLEVGSLYSDGLNLFIAVDKNQIRNYEKNVSLFKIPEEIICVMSNYKG